MAQTIADKLERLNQSRIDIGNAVLSVGGTAKSTDGLEKQPSNVLSINQPTQIGSSDVTFYDYDGTVLYSYTKNDFANLNSMPDNPTHEGLTAQGWNWDLSDAKTYVNKYGSLNIGQMYVTDDGKTRIYITLTEGYISPILQLYLNDNTELDIDWGDGSAHSTFTTT